MWCPLLFILFSVISPTRGNVISCGGFVRSHLPAVLQKMKVQLLSNEGHLKYETACNPSNGYYMIPVYNKGVFKIRVQGPVGYIFDPVEKVVDISDPNNDCEKSVDINFKLNAFKVSGKVISGKGTSGPRSLALGLFTQENVKVAETVTNEDGQYSFHVPNGKYVVSTLNPAAQCVERGSVNVDVNNSPVVVPTDLRISGQTVKVNVVGENGQGIKEATVLLFSDVIIPFDKHINTVKPLFKQSSTGGYEYSLETSASGQVSFTCLPSGAYRLKASWNKEGSFLAFEPKEKLITVGVKAEDITFKSSGFVVESTVGTAKDPIGNAEIFVKYPGKQEFTKVTKTDARGKYTLTGLKPDNYVIRAVKQKYQFEDKSVELSTKKAFVSPITVSKVEVCGRVVFGNAETANENNLQVDILSNGNVVQSESLNNAGAFCTWLEPGKYDVKPGFTSPIVYPKTLPIQVNSQPIESITFTEFKAVIKGSVKCIENCDSAEVHLLQSGKIIRTSVLRNSQFTFSDVTPGTYQLTVVDSVGRCWEQKEKEVKVESSNVDNVVIKQTGFLVNVQSGSDVELTYQKDKITDNIQVSTGKSDFCIPQRGAYKLSLLSCHQFREGSAFSLDLPGSGIVLSTHSSRVTAHVEGDKIKASDVTLSLKSDDYEVEGKLVQSSTSKLSYEFFVPQQYANTQFHFVIKSEKYLFTPTSESFLFKGECINDVVTFKATEGKFVTGKVTPALGDVVVTATNKKDGQVLTGKTSSNGQYKIGLVWEPSDYDVELELEGYKFTKTAANNFQALKLSKLVVTYFDEETQKSLGEVLVSVSGGVDYRSNVVVDQNGRKSFVGLPAGEYFITSVLREYEFQPNSVSVVVKEGETVERKIYGKRFAYSVFGKVQSIGGVPLAQLPVQALSEGCANLLEEDVTDAEGNYRVRGLKPGCQYRVSVKQTTSKSVPPVYTVETKKEDTEKIDFTVLTTAPLNDLVGLLQVENVTKFKSINIDLYEDGVKKNTKSITAPAQLFTFMRSLSAGKAYRVSVSERDLSALDASSEPVSFKIPVDSANIQRQVILKVSRKVHKRESETSSSNVFGVIFVILVTSIFMNLQNTKTLALDLFEKARGYSLRDSSPGAQDRKRKAKRS